MIFIDEPRLVGIVDYEQCIEQMTRNLADISKVLAVYQIGGLSAPGISDIDMVVVFEDDASYISNPCNSQDEVSQYLFVHPLFATSHSLFAESQRYTFFHNFRLLHGEELRPPEPHPSSDEDLVMKRQLAREFLVRMLINMTVEREFGVYKLRSLLLQGKALLYDLEFLQEQPQALLECINQIIDWREIWFSSRPPNSEISLFYEKFWNSLVGFLNEQFSSEPLFLPEQNAYKIGRNISIVNSKRVFGKSRGLKLPIIPNFYARNIISLQHRMNRFEIEIPISSLNIPRRLAESFIYTKRAWDYNHHNLPNFMPLTSSLVLRQ